MWTLHKYYAGEMIAHILDPLAGGKVPETFLNIKFFSSENKVSECAYYFFWIFA